VRSAESVAATPSDYQEYIASSAGEFSCAKPSCTRLANAWVSNRTLCYLASGKPAVVQDTGPSELLPDDGAVFRFTTIDEAAAALEAVDSDYERHSALARRLAEERFDATVVCGRLLERALA
jgi:glycosyltransferase involved in cell wall biosynthesis